MFRGVRLRPPGEPGQLLDGVDPSPLSFSVDESVAREYALRDGPGEGIVERHMLVFRTAAGGDWKHGASLDGLSQFPHEREVLFPVLSHILGVRRGAAAAATGGSEGAGLVEWGVDLVETGACTLEELAGDSE